VIATTAMLTAGTVLLMVAIVSPFSLLWAPGMLLVAWGVHRYRTRRQRWARQRAGARRGWLL
jgi:hypothetical protein